MKKIVTIVATIAFALLATPATATAQNPPRLPPVLQVHVAPGSVTVTVTNPNDLAWRSMVLCSAALDGHRLSYNNWFNGQDGLPLMVFPAEGTEQSLPSAATPGVHVIRAFCSWNSGDVTNAPDQTVTVP